MFTLNANRAHADISAEVSQLQMALNNLQGLSSFQNLETDAVELDQNITHALDLLESAREKGYHYQKDLDDLAVDVMSRWQSIQDQVLDDIKVGRNNIQNQLQPLSGMISRLNTSIGNPNLARTYLRTTQTSVNRYLSTVNQTQAKIQGLYSQIKSDTYKLTSKLSTIHWMLNQLEEAKFPLDKKEELVMAVSARWDQEGDDDPEGILFATNRKIVFERKEKVAKKKVLFVTVAKELVHEVMIEAPITDINGAKAENKGLFGHQDFLVVSFKDKKLGDVSFHIDGQDSKDWSVLISKIVSGKIADERSTGSSLSFSDLTGSLTQADIIEIQQEVNDLLDELMLKGIRGDFEALENDVRSLERQLAEVRAKGYVIESDLEQEVAILVTQWDRVKANATSTLDHQVKLMGEQTQGIQTKMARLAGLSGNLASARPAYMELKSVIASAEAQCVAAEDTVLAQFEDYDDEVDGLMAHLEWVEWMLDALATASFQLYATESGVAAAEAIWGVPGREPENGILYLTDQRLLWEDRVGEYELKVDIPLQQIVDFKKEVVEEGDDAGDEFLVLGFDGNAPFSSAKFDLAAPVADEWLKMIGRARNGEYSKDRAVEIDQGEIDRVKNAPTSCSNCSASFTSPVLRGQLEIVCEYCGTVTRF